MLRHSASLDRSQCPANLHHSGSGRNPCGNDSFAVAKNPVRRSPERDAGSL